MFHFRIEEGKEKGFSFTAERLLVNSLMRLNILLG
jgi:hypothetical protein